MTKFSGENVEPKQYFTPANLALEVDDTAKGVSILTEHQMVDGPKNEKGISKQRAQIQVEYKKKAYTWTLPEEAKFLLRRKLGDDSAKWVSHTFNAQVVEYGFGETNRHGFQIIADSVA